MTTNDFERYQLETAKTAVYPDAGEGSLIAVNYVTIGLSNEAGEVLGKVKKAWRDDDMQITEARKEALLDEAGDVLWYLARTADELGVSLQQIADRNLEKLFGRLERGTLKGSGDVR
jgi:NTP pyrophosphatase (non-canonical NTP hydrolase)